MIKILCPYWSPFVGFFLAAFFAFATIFAAREATTNQQRGKTPTFNSKQSNKEQGKHLSYGSSSTKKVFHTYPLPKNLNNSRSNRFYIDFNLYQKMQGKQRIGAIVAHQFGHVLFQVKEEVNSKRPWESFCYLGRSENEAIAFLHHVMNEFVDAPKVYQAWGYQKPLSKKMKEQMIANLIKDFLTKRQAFLKKGMKENYYGDLIMGKTASGAFSYQIWNWGKDKTNHGQGITKQAVQKLENLMTDLAASTPYDLSLSRGHEGVLQKNTKTEQYAQAKSSQCLYTLSYYQVEAWNKALADNKSIGMLLHQTC